MGGMTMTFTITMEVVSLLITFLLAMFHYDQPNRNNKQYHLFSACLFISFIAIALDILTSFTIDGTIPVPLPINYGLNMVYFFFQNLTFTVMAIYCFYLMFEHIADKHCYNIATTLIITFCVILELMLLTNPFTDWFFYFENTAYQRGIFNKLGYAFLFIEVCMLCMCYLRNRATVSRAMFKLIKVGAPVVVALALFQLLYQDTLMAGTIASLINLIFYITFQNNRVGQDSLTELPNRNTFFQELELKQKSKTRLHLILLHVNQMEEINQKYSTQKGDTFLYQVSRYLDRLSPHYQAFRFGNTRFLLMGQYHNDEEMNRITALIQQRFQEPWTAVDKGCYCTISFGHMLVSSDQLETKHIIDQLDYTLSQAREKAPNQAVFFDQQMQEQFERQIYVKNQIRYALDNDTFQVYYQPIYHCRQKTFTSAESLLRLFDENGKLISPAEFIPLAEQHGLIDEISWQLLEKVFAFLAKHPDLPLQTISVNMTMQQLTDRTFWNRIHGAQEYYGFPLDKLRIEITERTISENPALVQKIMEYLTEKGLRFYLDDFGIGYSNLANMMALPFETVKLDASLLQNIGQNEHLSRTIDLLIQMLHHAGFLVVAEGLENKLQVDNAHQLNVDSIQGFYYAKPMSEEELVDFLKQTK